MAGERGQGAVATSHTRLAGGWLARANKPCTHPRWEAAAAAAATPHTTSASTSFTPPLLPLLLLPPLLLPPNSE